MTTSARPVPADPSDRVADVIVVGAGPAGSAAAVALARGGCDVLLLEKSTFPREKVCGDGLTPRSVRMLVELGVPVPDAGWHRTAGLRVVGGGRELLLPWPELADFPPYGLVRRRQDFDLTLAQHAASSGARWHEGVAVARPLLDRAGRVGGVEAICRDVDGSRRTVSFHAPLVIAADGGSARLGIAAGRRRRTDRPLGVAVRTYFRSPRADDPWLDTWLEVPDGERPLPGYGWVFPMGDGTVNVGLGLLDADRAPDSDGSRGYRALLDRWLATIPADYGVEEATRTAPVRGAALPSGLNRAPQYADGLLLVGDAAGTVNPFNGEGIAYAMESGALAGRTAAQALARPDAAGREQVLAAYPRALRAEYAGYFAMGRAFVRLIGHPEVMRFANRHGLGHPRTMGILLRLLANLTDERGGRPADRVINALSRVVPAG